VVKKKRRPLTPEERKLQQRLLGARWRKLHPNYNKEWRKKHPDRVVELKRRWRSNPENVKREKAWAKAREKKMMRWWCALFHRKDHHRVSRGLWECSWCGRSWRKR